MPHKNIKVKVDLFDTIYYRCEFWRKTFGDESMSKFFTDGMMIYVNKLGEWYPRFHQDEIDYISAIRWDTPPGEHPLIKKGVTE